MTCLDCPCDTRRTTRTECCMARFSAPEPSRQERRERTRRMVAEIEQRRANLGPVRISGD